MIPPNPEVIDSVLQFFVIVIVPLHMDKHTYNWNLYLQLESQQENQLFDKLVAETRDIIESQDCVRVMNHCLDFGFNTFFKKVDEVIKQYGTSKDFE